MSLTRCFGKREGRGDEVKGEKRRELSGAAVMRHKLLDWMGCLYLGVWKAEAWDVSHYKADGETLTARCLEIYRLSVLDINTSAQTLKSSLFAPQSFLNMFPWTNSSSFFFCLLFSISVSNSPHENALHSYLRRTTRCWHVNFPTGSLGRPFSWRRCSICSSRQRQGSTTAVSCLFVSCRA